MSSGIPDDPGGPEFGRTNWSDNDVTEPGELPNHRGRAEAVAPVAPTWADRIALAPKEWFTEKPAARKWLLRDSRTALSSGVLPLGKAGMIIGEGGVSKTMALVALALAVALGESWLGVFRVATRGRVLLVLGEEDREEVQRRCYHVARASKLQSPPLGSIVVLPLSGVPCPMIEVDTRGNPQDAPFLVWLRTYVRESGPFALIVVDPLSRFAGVDAEVDNAAATRFIQALESIATETGATVLVVHHTNKMARGTGATVTGASARGSSAFYDGVRWAAALSADRVKCNDPDVSERLGEIVTLSIVKSNYSRKSEPVLLRRDPENGGALLPLDAVDLEMIAEARAGAEPGALRRAARDEEGRARTSTMGRAVLDTLAETPAGLSYRGLRAAITARLGTCSDPALAAAIASLGAAITMRPGPKRSTLHVLSEAASS